MTNNEYILANDEVLYRKEVVEQEKEQRRLEAKCTCKKRAKVRKMTGVVEGRKELGEGSSEGLQQQMVGYSSGKGK
jgi:hypothetical protein